MPKGVYQRKPKEVEAVAEVVQDAVRIEEKEERKPEVKAPVLDQLGANEQYFEAPDGTIIKGDKSKDRLWYRNMNNGEGGWINPKR